MICKKAALPKITIAFVVLFDGVNGGLAIREKNSYKYFHTCVFKVFSFFDFDMKTCFYDTHAIQMFVRNENKTRETWKKLNQNARDTSGLKIWMIGETHTVAHSSRS